MSTLNYVGLPFIPPPKTSPLVIFTLHVYTLKHYSPVLRAHRGDGVGHRGCQRDGQTGGGEYVHWTRGRHAWRHGGRVRCQDGKSWWVHTLELELFQISFIFH